ncbi:anti-repressor SinI family protein [Salibacterium halotolerans]|uniref:Anti-repressor SinI n=1 Tax=Salibacterium halotolerans TaxID=1884432 RepID=A0A1I5RLE1_9BACI|nr:anti-repressor SinI family protein [Salibacterium halotolerans]SFP59157.1 Anti-repressor SinI [Salibacterium halotolerans]
MSSNEESRDLDKEWVELIDEAKYIGLSPEEVLVFLSGSNKDESG